MKGYEWTASVSVHRFTNIEVLGGGGGGGVRSDDSIILFSLTFSGLMKQEATYPHQREKREISVDFWEINWKLALLMNLFDTSTVCSRLILSRHLINEHNAKWKDFKN